MGTEGNSSRLAAIGCVAATYAVVALAGPVVDALAGALPLWACLLPLAAPVACGLRWLTDAEKEAGR